jgi:putative membrane protein
MMQTTLSSRFDRKIALPAIGLVSLLAIVFLFWLIYFRQNTPSQQAWVGLLPALNAFLNGSSAVLIVLGLSAIKRKLPLVHMRYMLGAFASSSLFLISYIVYHSLHGDSKFLAQGLIRPIYFFTLISHIGLSIVALPLVLITFYFALTRKTQIHRKIAKWTYPLWLYVSVTGVLIFALLKLFNRA